MPANTAPLGVQSGRVARIDGLQVGPGAEHVARTGDDADEDAVVLFELVDGRLDALGDVAVDGVLGLGPVDGDDGDGAALLVVDHGRRSLSAAVLPASG